ncbi:MAG TPA: phenylalanine--tRNA ligase subunit beta, partial [Chroococcales cyanobacterium]
DLLIADEERAVAIAGVMGGANTEVDENTTEVLLESANFHPSTIRRTANRLALRTDAAIRFEKSLDPGLTVVAIRRFYQILKISCPDLQVVGKIADFWPQPPKKVEIPIKPDFLNLRLGTALKKERMKEIFESLGFEVSEKIDHWQVLVPSYRATKDVSIPEDLVEEIGRIFGYDNIPPEAPSAAIAPPFQEPQDLLAKKIKNVVSLQGGYSEVYCYSFNGEEGLRKLGMDPEKNLKLRNPLNNEQNLMRRSLLPNMLNVAAENFKRFDRFSLYEIGPVFLSEDFSKLPDERSSFCALATGRKSPDGELFYEAKGLAELLIDELRLSDIQFVADPSSLETWMHPGRTAFMRQGEKNLGVVTELHPKVADLFALGGNLGVLLLDLPSLMEAKKIADSFESVPVFPAVTFDVSVLVDVRTPVVEVEKILRQADRKFLKEIKIFDIYSGKNLPEGKKSLAFSLLFSSSEKTLEPKDIERLQKRVIDVLEKGGCSVRSSK